MQDQQLPKSLWMYWNEGLEKAPWIVKKCIDTWHDHNSNWDIRVLSDDDLKNHLNLEDIIPQFHKKNIQPEALSDIIRVSLLKKYGGVWADGTLYCNKPLDHWLYTCIGQSGFFAFSKPPAGTLISSWFLAATRDNYIIDRWYHATVEYWKQRLERDEYFWFHHLFEKLNTTDNTFKKNWDCSTVKSALDPHYFFPYDQHYPRSMTPEIKSIIDSAEIPVFKLTHKYNQPAIKGSILDYLLHHKSHTKILIAWYGAFEGHGTIGDLLSMQSLTSHLHDQGIQFDHATHENFRDIQGKRVDWQAVNAEDYTLFIWVCGPILKNHPHLAEIFGKFAGCTKIGIGVSLFTSEHFNYFNPFDFVFAREGTIQVFDDIALAAPMQRNVTRDEENKSGLTIGLSLRGPQSEYGEENCLHELTERIVTQLAHELLQNRHGQIIMIENHLKRAAKTPQEIEHLYAKCNLILTSRLHGALLALRHSVPYIAIDQIKNGAKVSAILQTPKWPYVYQAEQADPQEMLLIGNEILGTIHANQFAEVRAEMIERARASLQTSVEFIQSMARGLD